MKAKSKQFASYGFSPRVDEVCELAGAFMTELGPERIISVCSYGGAMIVWYWDEAVGDETVHEWS